MAWFLLRLPKCKVESMNNAAVCTEKCSSNGNPLSALKAAGGRIADSLKTAARSVVSSNAGMFAGLSMLTAASGTALATEVVLRDTIHDSPATTQNGKWVRCNQIPDPVPADMLGASPTASAACLAVTIPPNSICSLKNLVFVFGVKSTTPMQSPDEDQYDWRKLFNTYNGARTTDVMLQVIEGPSTNLVRRLNGDIYTRSLSESDFESSMSWGSTAAGIAPGESLPYYRTELSFTGINVIETGDSERTIYIKVSSVAMQSNATFMVWANTLSDQVSGDVRLTTGTQLNVPATAYAAKVVADIRPKEVAQPVPACGLERIDGKMAVCWPASYGTNYTVGSSTNFTQWGPQEIEKIVTENGKNYAVLVTNGASLCFFRLESK